MREQILQAIGAHDRIIILRHIAPDGDAYGVQFGLKEIIKTNWPEKEVFVAGHDSEFLNFIGKMDQVTDVDFRDSLVIIGDCANLKRVDDRRYSLAKTIIKIDHHPDVEKFGDISWVDPEYSSASEMIADWAHSNNLKITAAAARVIFHGMVTDSGRFLYAKTNARTFALASFLLTTNFDLETLYKQMYLVKEPDLKFISFVYQNYQTTTKGVAYLVLTQEQLQQLKLDYNHAASKVNLLSNIESKPIWAFFSENEQHQLRVELRSNQFRVNEVATKYGGGGHKFAAGILINSRDLIPEIIKDLDKMISRAVT